MLTGYSKTMIALELPPPQNVSALRNAPPLSVARRWVAENRTPTRTCVYLRVCVCVWNYVCAFGTYVRKCGKVATI